MDIVDTDLRYVGHWSFIN